MDYVQPELSHDDDAGAIMEKTAIPSFGCAAKAYCLLTKPGIIFGNVVTTAGGMALAARGHLPFYLLLQILLGISLVIGSACIFNNYIDRYADQRMRRTKNRGFAKGSVTAGPALILAVLLGLLGIFLLAFYANLLAAGIALFGFFVYVILYSWSKYHSIHGTLIGSVAGAVPPVVGYCALSGRLDIGALILFAIVALWQMPHFFAIAIYRLEDYAAASIPVLPLKKGILTTKVHMLLYILAFLIASLLPAAFHYVGYPYLIIALILGLSWLRICIQGFKCEDDAAWARKMFFFSLVVIIGICTAVLFN
jgi:protoheme IX farnesyltransferase